jgi:hypothetical protein
MTLGDTRYQTAAANNPQSAIATVDVTNRRIFYCERSARPARKSAAQRRCEGSVSKRGLGPPGVIVRFLDFVLRGVESLQKRQCR